MTHRENASSGVWLALPSSGLEDHALNICYDRGHRKGPLKVGEMLCLQKYLEASPSLPGLFTIRITYSFNLISLLLKMNKGNSLVVQWLGLCAITAKGAGSIPGRGTKITPATQHSQKRNKNEIWEKISKYQCKVKSIWENKWNKVKINIRKTISSTKDILSSAKWWTHKQSVCKSLGTPTVRYIFVRILPINSVEGRACYFLTLERSMTYVKVLVSEP